MGLLDRMRKFAQPAGGAWSDDASDNVVADVDAIYSRQLAALQDVRRAVVDAMGTRKRLEGQADRLHMAIARHQDDAQAAAAAGRDDDARTALGEALRTEKLLPDLEALLADLRVKEAALQAGSTQLRARVEAFRIEKETLKAREAMLAAQLASDATLSDLSTELAATRDLLRRAEVEAD